MTEKRDTGQSKLVEDVYHLKLDVLVLSGMWGLLYFYHSV